MEAAFAELIERGEKLKQEQRSMGAEPVTTWMGDVRSAIEDRLGPKHPTVRRLNEIYAAHPLGYLMQGGGSEEFSADVGSLVERTVELLRESQQRQG